MNYERIAAIVLAFVVGWLLTSSINRTTELHRTEQHAEHLQHRVDSLSSDLTAHRDSMETFRWWIEHTNGGTLEQVYLNLKRLKRDTE